MKGREILNLLPLFYVCTTFSDLLHGDYCLMTSIYIVDFLVLEWMCGVFNSCIQL